jgi:dUTPase
MYVLSLDDKFSGFLCAGVTWLKSTRNAPERGFADDPADASSRRTAQQRVAALELMLGQIANFCPVIARNSIVKNSISLDDIRQRIRLHYGFQLTGAHFLDLADIRLEVNEKPEDLYQRINAFFEDNLLTRNSTITHHGEVVGDDEECGPTMENVIVFTWLRLLDPNLPRLVKQRYGTELRSRTLATIKPEISMAIDVLGGMPFMRDNDVHIRPAKSEVSIGEGVTYSYDGRASQGDLKVRRTQTSLIRATKTMTVWPGEFIQVDVPMEHRDSAEFVVEPRLDSGIIDSSLSHWPSPAIIESVGEKLRLANPKQSPIVIKKGQHIAQISAVDVVDTREHRSPLDSRRAPQKICYPSCNYRTVKVNPDALMTEQQAKNVEVLHAEMSTVFDDDFNGYNGGAGVIEGVINMGPVQPPQRKGRVPQYSRDKLVELQRKLDELEQLGVIGNEWSCQVIGESRTYYIIDSLYAW